MRKTVIAAALATLATPALACPDLAIGETFSIEKSKRVSLEGPAGYEAHVMEVPDTMLQVNLRPAGVTPMDLATGKVSAPLVSLTLTLRALPPGDLELVRSNSAGKPTVELAGGGVAYRDDFTGQHIRYYAYPEIGGEHYTVDVQLHTSPDCHGAHEAAAREIVRSLRF